LLLGLGIGGCFPEVADTGGKVRHADPSSDDTGVPDTDETDTTDDTQDTTGESGGGDTDETGDTVPTDDTAVEPVDADHDGWTVEDGDCDDTAADVYPGAGEAYDAAGLGRDDDCDGEIDEPPTIDLVADDVRVWVTLTDVKDDDWWFGMAETGCGGDCWYGEDCIDDPADDRDYDYEICHPLIGSAVALAHGTIDTLEAGSTTLFYGDLMDTTTFYLANADETICWVWGDDPSWYLTEDHGGPGMFPCDEI
jgi:hypothetical protein